MHRHFLDPLALDFWPVAYYYSSTDFMTAVRSICLSVSRFRILGCCVVSTIDRPGEVIISRNDQAALYSFSVEGRSGGSVASLTQRVSSLADGLVEALPVVRSSLGMNA
jgi:hypothetical protein